ncbi:MAG: YidC/Oxa1 family membrane protein insertase [Clostridia bacterium]|nr:YidC/Oxa1 family membrane protein insertase [Clostridia bacterium]
MASFFGIIATPFGYIMRFMYDLIGNYGLCIILFSLLVKIITSPLMYKQKKSMLATQRLQPKIQEIQRKYAGDKARMNEEMQALYDRENASPTSGCGTMIVTMVVLFGLYYVILQPLTYVMHLSSAEISSIAETLGMEMKNARGMEIQLAGKIFDNFDLVKDISSKIIPINFNFLGIDLSAKPDIKQFGLNWLIPFFSGLTAFGASWLQTRMQNKNVQKPQGAPNTSLMTYVLMPAMSVYFCFILPAGLGLYWIANNVFGMATEPIFNKLIKKEQEIEKVAK